MNGICIMWRIIIAFLCLILFFYYCACSYSLSVAQTLHSLYQKESNGLCGLTLKTMENSLNILGSQPEEDTAIAQFLCL